MVQILTRAGCFVAIIALGYILRKKGIFREQDFGILSKILLKITLPAAIVSNFVGRKLDASMLFLTFIGLGASALYVALAYLMNMKAKKEHQMEEMVSMGGYNIGAFTMPFAQGFLGATGVITTSLFDIGNACVCLGGSYGLAKSMKEGGKFSLATIGKALVKSIAFDCYFVMAIVALFQIPIPKVIVSFAEIVGNANPFVAMLMIGVGFKIAGDKKQIGRMVRILSVRYGVALLLALGCYHILPFPLEVRQALMIVLFSPFPSSAPAYTGELKCDVGFASALNSVSIVCSLICIVTILTVTL